MQLSEEDRQEIEEAAAQVAVHRDRYLGNLEQMTGIKLNLSTLMGTFSLPGA